MTGDEQQRIVQRYAERDASAALRGLWSPTNPVALHLTQQRDRLALAALADAGVELAGRRLLDVGCGGGHAFAGYLGWGLDLDAITGVDLAEPRLRDAQRRYGGRAAVAVASGAALPFADASFGVVVQNVVFSSIVDDAMRRAVAAEMRRVLRRDGVLLWYDAARARSRDRHLRNVPAAELRALFPDVDWRLRRLTSDLGLLRRVQRGFGRPGMLALDAAGVFATHLLALGRPR